MVLEADVSFRCKILDLAPGFSFPVDHLHPIQLDLDNISPESDLVKIPFSRWSKGIRPWRFRIVDRTRLVDPAPAVIDLDLEGVIDVIIAGGNFWDSEEDP